MVKRWFGWNEMESSDEFIQFSCATDASVIVIAFDIKYYFVK